jgi:hypothetical protein
MICAKLRFELILGVAPTKGFDMSAATPLRPRGDPFLLPFCDCGGPMNLASLEPHPVQPDHEVKTFKCSRCGAQAIFDVQRRTASRNDRG